MFSRSEKTEDVMEVAADQPGERSPMVLAALAGLLAIAGAFLLVWYLNNNGDGEVATASNGEVVEGTAGQEATEAAATTRQVLVVTQTIPRNTSVRELIDAPTVYLSAQAVPENFVAASAITSVAELSELEGFVLASEALPGEQLLRGRFRDPSDFDSNDTTFIEEETGIAAPAGHHAMVLELPSSRAMGGNIRAGEKVTVLAAFRPTPDGRAAYQLSVVVLNSVEVLNIQSALEVAGQISQDVNQFGQATRGNLVITVAVKPEEITDLAFALEYGEITLATALAGLENEDGPRAATTMAQIVGDDGVWLAEIDDGINLINLAEEFLSDEVPTGESIELELPEEEDEEQDATPEDTLSEDDAGDS